MNEISHNSSPPKLVENSLLVIAALIAHAPLYYQLPRWANGLNPTHILPVLIQNSKFPAVLYLAGIHPLFWIAVMIIIFIRLCRNYGWTLKK
jgi:hypothetical protein